MLPVKSSFKLTSKISILEMGKCGNVQMVGVQMRKCADADAVQAF